KASTSFFLGQASRPLCSQALGFLLRPPTRFFFSPTANFFFGLVLTLDFGTNLRFNLDAQASFLISTPACFVFRLAARFFLGAVTGGLGGQALRFFGRLEPRTFASMHALNFFFDSPHAQFGATTQLFFVGPLARFSLQIAPLFFGATGGLI